MSEGEEENELIIHITIKWDDVKEYQPPALDIAAYSVVNTLHWYVKGFAIPFLIGLINTVF